MRHNLRVSHGLTCTLCNIYIYIYDFCYLGSIVAENGGTSREVSARIQKARG